jgi:DDE superfamily endonuclease
MVRRGASRYDSAGARFGRHGRESGRTNHGFSTSGRGLRHGRGQEEQRHQIQDVQQQLQDLVLRQENGAETPQLDANSIRYQGLNLVGFDRDRQAVGDNWNSRRFRSFFGVGERALAAMYNNLNPKPDLDKFLMTINWLKLYDTEHVLSGRWGLHENTIRTILKKHSESIQGLKAMKVVWGDFDDEEVFLLTVDGVHCRIQEVRKDPGAKWYDHKTHGPGLSYELGIAIRSNRLVWINGPFPASRHDITTFRSDDNPGNGLKDSIPEGKRAIGDSGYRGEPTKVAVTREGDSDEVKRFKARAKARHETFNGRIKSFKILDTAFRHGFERHKTVFEAVCICVQYDIENGHGLFEI